MDTSTGQIAPFEIFKELFPTMPKPDFVKRFRPVISQTLRQDITKQILAYEPCPCGSGKKFKFCCHLSDQNAINQRMANAKLLK